MGAIRVGESGVTELTRGALIVRIIVTLGEAADEALEAVLGWAEVVKVALLCAGAGGANAVGETVWALIGAGADAGAELVENALAATGGAAEALGAATVFCTLAGAGAEI